MTAIMIMPLYERLSTGQRRLIASAINKQGDGGHPLVTERNAGEFDLIYMLHCLGKHYRATIGTDREQWTDFDELQHNMHEEILDEARKLMFEGGFNMLRPKPPEPSIKS